MNRFNFTEILSFSNNQISEAIIETEKELFSLQFKKATRQPFKSHEIKNTKRYLAQLKTLLTKRLNILEKKRTSTLHKILKKQNYMLEKF